MPTFTILYGFAEGPQHGVHLRQTLKSRGYTVTDNPRQADIVIAHSGAAHLLPAGLRCKLLVLTTPSCGSSRANIILTSLQKAAKDVRLVISAQSQKPPAHLVWNAWYLLRHPRRNRAMQRETFRAQKSLPHTKAHSVAVITYKGDPWRRHTPVNAEYCHISLPGSHDSLWYKCEDFANTVQLLYEQLLA